jgi:hypothetical protein
MSNEPLGIVAERQAIAAKYARFIAPPVRYIVDPATGVRALPAPRLAPAEVEPIEPPVVSEVGKIAVASVQHAFLNALWESGYRLKVSASSAYSRCYQRQDLVCKARRRDISWPRHVCMDLVRRICRVSYPKIGREFGRRDHTTVMHAIWTAPAHMVVWPVLADVHARVLAEFEVKQ